MSQVSIIWEGPDLQVQESRVSVAKGSQLFMLVGKFGINPHLPPFNMHRHQLGVGIWAWRGDGNLLKI